MASLISSNEIEGASVYGVRQYSYTVDGNSNSDFAHALTVAALRQSTSIEETTAALSDVVELRQRKVGDLGDALAILAKAIATLKTKNSAPADKSDSDSDLATAKSKLAYYGLKLNITSDNKIRRDDAMKAQSDIQYALDVEDNNLQQDIVSLKGMMTRRDNAFSTAAKVVKKSLDASGNTIRNY